MHPNPTHGRVRVGFTRVYYKKGYPVRAPTLLSYLDNRIINGKKSDLIPWLVSLGYVFKDKSGNIKYSHFCGGMIANEMTLITAGHFK